MEFHKGLNGPHDNPAKNPSTTNNHVGGKITSGMSERVDTIMTKRSNVLVENRAASLPYANAPITIPAASAANNAPSPVGLSIDSKYVGKMTVSIGIYKPDKNMNPIASANNGLSRVSAWKPSRNDEKNGSCPSS